MSDDTTPGVTDYSAEKPVDLRGQRLRPAPVMVAAESSSVEIPDPYGVGQDALTGLKKSSARRGHRGPDRMELLAAPEGAESDPAGWGWRGRLNAALGTRLRPRLDSAELSHRLAVERIRQSLPGMVSVTVANPKGGQGKTPATLLLSNTFGKHRGGGVVAWDTAESRGTLAARAARTSSPEVSVWDVLSNAAALCSPHAEASGLSRFLRAQPTMDEVLAADQSSTRTDAIGWDECAAIMAVLRRHRTMAILDTSNNDRATNFRWAIEHTDQLVVPLTFRRDATHEVLRMLDGIAARGHGRVVETAIVVLAESTAPNDIAERAVVSALNAAGVKTLVRVPFDPVLASGERIVYSRLSQATVLAWTEVAASVADGLVDACRDRAVSLEADFVPQSRLAPVEFDTRPTSVLRRPDEERQRVAVPDSPSIYRNGTHR